jgi:hypothetical protein
LASMDALYGTDTGGQARNTMTDELFTQRVASFTEFLDDDVWPLAATISAISDCFSLRNTSIATRFDPCLTPERSGSWLISTTCARSTAI